MSGTKKLCPNCSGIIYGDGKLCVDCKFKQLFPEGSKPQASHTSTSRDEASTQSSRILCSGGACYGVLNDKGFCKVCGKWYKQESKPAEAVKSDATQKVVQERHEQQEKEEIFLDNETKKCPFCAEMIKTEAIKCRYCGEWLNKQSAISGKHDQPAQDLKQSGQFVSLTKSAPVPSGSPSQQSTPRLPINQNQNHQKQAIENYLKKFKKVVIASYSVLFAAFLIDFFEGDTRQIVLATWSICILILSGYFWHYLWNSAKLVGKRPLHYVGLSFFIPIIGPVIAYSMLNKASEEINAGAIHQQ